MSIPLTTFDEINTGHVNGPVPWRLTAAQVDAALCEYDQWRPPFVGSDEQGRRIIPPCVSVGPAVAASPFRFRGIAAGVELHNHGHLYQDRDYAIDLYVDEKYEKRGRQYIWFRATFSDEARTAHEYRWLQVLSPVANRDISSELTLADVRDVQVDQLNEFPYVPPVPVVRGPDWQLTEASPAVRAGYLPDKPEPGTQLLPRSVRFTWTRARDYAEWRRLRTGEPPSSAAWSVHSHSGAAREIGLDAANISGANIAPYLTDLVLDAFGDRWLLAGSLSVKFLKPLGLTDYFVASGSVESTTPEATTVTLTGQNQAGETVLVGSATVARR
ncbi:hypothetical protein [Luedemannella helvata]|uniref:Uncharacterized protein n=1 Tax=Luedemannella helvata TaxID=349315 RepID=A0ABP4VWJ2_9ACTN